MTEATERDIRQARPARAKGALVHRQSIWTRLTHWIWAACLFFLLLSGLQIFNAHPALYIGDQSGFAFDNAVLKIGARRAGETIEGVTTIFGTTFETTGVLGASGPEGALQARGFPAWATIPSYRDLASGRVVHFFFAWALVFTLAIWAIASLANGHLRRDILPRPRDVKALPRDIAAHARFKLSHGRSYNPLQKISYALVLLVLLPLMVLTGLAMSPGFNAALPILPELFGGRQTARTIHFAVMVMLVLFFIVHVVMVLLAGPFNELRSMITGWMRVDPEERDEGSTKR